jgi:hypothetical protein
MIPFVKWFAIVVAILLAALIVIGFLLPKGYAVERSITIEAPPERIHRLVGDLKRWEEWTPWREADPSLKMTFGSTTTGVGASQSWQGKSGGGELTFTASDPQTGVAYDMSFDGQIPNQGAIRYQVTPAGTVVTWAMEGEMGNIIARYMGLMMDALVGPSFEAGLTKLKEQAEAMPDPTEAEEVEPEPAAAVG